MTRTLLGALLADWRRRPLELASLVVGLALATALWSGVQAINAEARASYAAAAQAVGGDRPALVARSGGAIDAERFVALRRAGWLVTPVLEGRLEAPGGGVRLVGIEPLTAIGSGLAPSAAPQEVARGDVLLAAPETAARLVRAEGLPEVQAVDGLPPGLAFADIGLAQRLLRLEGRVSRLVLLPEQPFGRPPLAEVAPDLVPQAEDGLGRLTDSFHLNLTAFGLLAFAVGLFIVHGAIGLAFERRRPMIRTLRALGVPAGRLLATLAAELLLLALAGGAIGVVLGWVFAAALLPGVAATLRGLYGAAVEGGLALRPEWWLGGLGASVAGTAVAAAGAIWRIARMPLLAPARPRAWAMASERALALQAGAAAALGLVAVLLALWGRGVTGGFATLGALLLAAALALPPLLALALRLGQALARGPLATWFWADARQQLRGLSLALMALLLALAANIGVGTMVASFRVTFTGWLDQRLAAELYVTAETEAQAEAVEAFLATRADAVLPIVRTGGRTLGREVELYGVADDATYRENWPLLAALPGVWDLVAAGEALLVNEQLARRAGLAPGDPVPLPGGPVLPVGGVYSDYGNPDAQLLVGLPLFDALYPEAERMRFAVRVPPERADALAGELQRTLGLPADAVTAQAEAKRVSLEIFERTFAVTAALNILTLAVAGFAMLTALLTLAGLRLPQVAPVWASGVPRRRLAALELLRALLLALLTAALAIPVGLLLAWVLLAVVNVEAFGWRLPMRVFPGEWLRLALLAALAAVLAALWPARRLASRPAAEFVKVFAHER